MYFFFFNSMFWLYIFSYNIINLLEITQVRCKCKIVKQRSDRVFHIYTKLSGSSMYQTLNVGYVPQRILITILGGRYIYFFDLGGIRRFWAARLQPSRADFFAKHAKSRVKWGGGRERQRLYCGCGFHQ